MLALGKEDCNNGKKGQGENGQTRELVWKKKGVWEGVESPVN